ncbi:MAG: N-acetylmuramoyl-L-alanine amidase [Nitrospirae bacterium]|nr:N-acetylmuramoyl-L-alanine amidase [Nitrospirota bacterium]
MKVINGTSDGMNRISSASIKINGIEVVKESDFNQQVAIIERPVSLGTDNRLLVKLQSNPGGFISVEISGISVMPSVKKVIGPLGGTIALQGTLNRVELGIQPGALAADTEITIRQVPNPTPDRFFLKDQIPIGNTFSFEPHGLSFSKVAAITFTYRDEDLPPDADEGEISVYVEASDGLFHSEGGAICHPEEVPGDHCIDTESTAQSNDYDNNLVDVFVNRLSHRLLAIAGVISGCNGDPNAQPTPVTLEAEGFDLPMLRCLRPNVGTRPVTAQITKIVLHSTANTNVRRTFANEIARCAIDRTQCPGFAHYYIDRDGSIIQVTEDANLSLHTRSNNDLDVDNDNSIGIEIFNNVGEPYDGRQITALIQLMDILIRLNPTIERPVFPRENPLTSATSVFTHAEIDPDRRVDPAGIFRTSSEVWFFDQTARIWTTRPLPGGSPDASTLFDAAVSGVSAMERDFTGLLNTQGGDSLGLADAGRGGDISYMGGGLAQTPLLVGTNHTDNNPLIVPPNAILDLAVTDFTDIIINGTLRLPVSITLRASGTIFISPQGRITAIDQTDAPSMTLNSNGSPIINGIIDLRGRNGEINPSSGGRGGDISISTATEGPLFIPTIITRGGDSDSSDCPNSQVNPPISCTSHISGAGGDIMISSLLGDIILSGTRSSDSSFIPDTLAPPPPFNLGTPEKPRPGSGERLPLLSSSFNRGLLTTGGIGGSGIGSGFTAGGGGTGGDGGSISIARTGTDNINLILRDIDLFTGGSIEEVVADIFLPSLGTTMRFDAPTGSLGGKGTGGGGSRGADGGKGGRGGNIELGAGLQFNPPPALFIRTTILGHNGENPNFESSVPIGEKVSAFDGNGNSLYSLKVFDDSGIEKTLGGSGGFSGGSASTFPGWFGLIGNGGTISSTLPTR